MKITEGRNTPKRTKGATTMKLQDKITIITGASSGMGKAMAKLFTQEGAIVYAIDLVEDRLHQTVEEIKNGFLVG